jgi:tetratricopeptide (TPR) repeat protein
LSGAPALLGALVAAAGLATSAAAVAAPPPLPDPAGCKGDAPAPAACDAAIASEADPKAKSVLLFRRAYARNAADQSDAALPDLTEAVALWPDNWQALHERGYTLNALGRYAEAAHDLDAQVRLAPDLPEGYSERAFARFRLGDLDGTFEDRQHETELSPDNGGAHLALARAAMWLGRFDVARQELDVAETLTAKPPEVGLASAVAKERQTLALWSTHSAGENAAANCDAADRAGDLSRKNLIGDCTLAFLAAKSGREKAEALTDRAIASMALAQDRDADLADKQLAVALDPENGDWHANLGFAYASGRHSRAALAEFDRSVALKPTFSAYAGRAYAHFNLGQADEAFADAKKSFEMRPNDVALTLMGDLFYEQRHDAVAAKKMWMAAYRMGDRDDGLIANLKKVGVTDPEKEPASDPKP